MVMLNVIDAADQRHAVEAADGLSIMEAVRPLGFGVAGECEGSLACATCHVWVQEEWLPLLSTVSDDEADMLDCAFHVKTTSRLSCQIKITRELEGMTVAIPHK